MNFRTLATATTLLVLAGAAVAAPIDENTYGQDRIPARAVAPSTGTFPGYPGFDENAYGQDRVVAPPAKIRAASEFRYPGFDENAYGIAPATRVNRASTTAAAAASAPDASVTR